MKSAGLAFAGVLGWLLSGCGSCPRDGCDALEQPSSAYVDTGIKGSVASSSDVVVNGCQECPFSDTELRVWVSATSVSGTIQRDTLLQRAPDLMVFAEGRYTQALATGHYMVCESSAPCLGFDLASGDDITINVKQRYGPTSFVVFGAAGQRVDEFNEFWTLAGDCPSDISC